MYKKIIGNILFIPIVIIGISMLFSSQNNPFGMKSYIVLTGSMEPTIRTGSVIFTKPQGSYKIGDIISFTRDGQIFTHRINNILQNGMKTSYVTKGDANISADENPVGREELIGRAFVTIPYLGYLLNFTRTLPGLILLVLVPALLIIFSEIRNIIAEVKKLSEENASMEIQWQKIITVLIFCIFGLLIFANAPKVLAYLSSLVIFPDNTVTTTTGGTPTTTPTPTSTPSLTPTPTITPTSTQNIANHVVISEVQIDAGSGDPNDYDFIELYNPTNLSIPLNGLKLVKRTENNSADGSVFTFLSGQTIQSHGFFLWAHNDSTNHYAAAINADASSSATLASNNSIAIKNISTGETIDALSWDASALSLKEGTEFSPDPGDYQSMERKALSTSTIASMTTGTDVDKGNGYDAGDNATDFILRPTSQPQNSSSLPESL